MTATLGGMCIYCKRKRELLDRYSQKETGHELYTSLLHGTQLHEDRTQLHLAFYKRFALHFRLHAE